jgi:hypothetical protein
LQEDEFSSQEETPEHPQEAIAPPETVAVQPAPEEVPERQLPWYLWPLLGLVVSVVVVVAAWDSGDSNQQAGNTPAAIDQAGTRLKENLPDAGTKKPARTKAMSLADAGPTSHAKKAGGDDRARDMSLDLSAATRPLMLAIRSRPSGCRVEVDGIPVPGETPMDEVAVDPLKKHTVSVKCKRHREEVQTITGKPGQRLALEFKPSKVATLPKPKPGLLYIDTAPWSEVFLGKRKLGMTPILGYKLPPGTYTLKAVNEGRGLKKNIKVTIRSGKTTKVRVDLKD